MKLKSAIYLLFFLTPVTVMAQKVRLKDLKVPSIAQQGDIVIKGKIGDLNPPCQLWIYIGKEEWDTIAVKNGRFEYRINTLLPASGAIVVKYRPMSETGMLLSGDFDLKTTYFDAGEMYINSPSDSIKNAVFSGSAAAIHNQYYEYVAQYSDLQEKQRRLASKLVTTTPENLQSADYMAKYEKDMEKIYREMDSQIESHIRKYPDSWSSTGAFQLYLSARQGNIDTAKVMGYLDLFSKEVQQIGLFGVPNSEFRPRMEQRIRNLEQKVPINVRPRLLPGDVAPTFTQASIDGSSVSLKDFKGRYVLLDFWASWCVPCRKVNPDLVRLYEKYQGPRFEILGISLDKDKEKWEKAIEEDGLNWKHVSDLNYWDNEVAVMYGIDAIPRNFLVDPEGKIVAVNLNVADLDAKLETLLK